VDGEAGARFSEMLENISGALQDASVAIADYAGGLELDEEELHQLEERLDCIARLKRKYGGSVEAVLATGERLRTRLASLKGRSGRLAELQETLQHQEEEHRELCRLLRTARLGKMNELAEAICGKLLHLGFLKAQFSIELSETEPGASGSDIAEFQFAPNAGEPAQPLRAIASSGEIARVMLALKTVLSEADTVPVLVFDEIDANIGGRVAVAVSEELAAVGRRHQVFCITHLPQIDAAGNHHYRVSKSVVDERTFTRMVCLDEAERERELVRMLGAEEDSQAALEHARNLRKNAEGFIANEE